MKKAFKKITLLALCLALVFSFVACGNNDSVWADATYVSNTEIGQGEKTVKVEVLAEDKTILFTIKTDALTVGAALIENNLIEGEESQYGLYIKKVNGMTADYDVNQTYWAFYVNGEYAVSGIDSTEIDQNATYRLEYAK